MKRRKCFRFTMRKGEKLSKYSIGFNAQWKLHVHKLIDVTISIPCSPIQCSCSCSCSCIRTCYCMLCISIATQSCYLHWISIVLVFEAHKNSPPLNSIYNRLYPIECYLIIWRFLQAKSVYRLQFNMKTIDVAHETFQTHDVQTECLSVCSNLCFVCKGVVPPVSEQWQLFQCFTHLIKVQFIVVDNNNRSRSRIVPNLIV